MVGLPLAMSIYGEGNLRSQREAERPRLNAAADAGTASLMMTASPATEEPDIPIVEADGQTPEKVQKFPGPPLQPSPEHAGRESEPAQALPNAQGPVFYVTGSRVNFRAGPSTGDRVIGSLGQGAAVEVMGSSDGAWVNIRDGDGRIGYISGQFLSETRP